MLTGTDVRHIKEVLIHPVHGMSIGLIILGNKVEFSVAAEYFANGFANKLLSTIKH